MVTVTAVIGVVTIAVVTAVTAVTAVVVTVTVTAIVAVIVTIIMTMMGAVLLPPKREPGLEVGEKTETSEETTSDSTVAPPWRATAS